MTVFGLALGERKLTGSSLSSGSKPVASMSTATHTDRQEHRHTGVEKSQQINVMIYTVAAAQKETKYKIKKKH